MSSLLSINPATYETIGEVPVSSKDEIREKVKKANNAQSMWREFGLEKRISLLRKVVNQLLKRKEELAHMATKEMGMPISHSRGDAQDGIDFFNWYVDNAPKYLSPEVIYRDGKTTHTVFYEPFGTAAVITPWNFPVSNFVWSTAQNLIAGNTVVYKTSEECPLFGKLLEETVQSAGLPEGVFSEVYGDGDVGDFLAHQNIQLLCFTGSSKVGKYLYKVAGEKFIKAICELGGSAPGIVFPDADLATAVEKIYDNRFSNCGQMCDALKRLIVHESVYDSIIANLKNKLQSVHPGSPDDETTNMGPLVAKRQLELLESQVKDALDKGAEIVTGGKRPAHLKGAYYDPTILTNIHTSMRVWQEEIFGPVLPVVRFKTDEEALRMANDTRYGLGSYIYTKNKQKAIQIASHIQAGMVSINNTSYVRACSPFGGYKESGMGREHGKFGFAELTQVKVVAIDK